VLGPSLRGRRGALPGRRWHVAHHLGREVESNPDLLSRAVLLVADQRDRDTLGSGSSGPT
jgi:hypothetical protein